MVQFGRTIPFWCSCAARRALKTYPICHNLPMCGRYRLSRRKQLVDEYFGSASGEDEEWNPRYNIAPTAPGAYLPTNPRGAPCKLTLTLPIQRQYFGWLRVSLRLGVRRPP